MKVGPCLPVGDKGTPRWCPLWAVWGPPCCPCPGLAANPPSRWGVVQWGSVSLVPCPLSPVSPGLSPPLWGPSASSELPPLDTAGSRACVPACTRVWVCKRVCTGMRMRVSVRVAVCALCLGTLPSSRVPLHTGICCPPSPVTLPELWFLSPCPPARVSAPVPGPVPSSPVSLPELWLLSPVPLLNVWLLSSIPCAPAQALAPVPCAPTHTQLHLGAWSEPGHVTNPSSAHPFSTGWHLGGNLPVPAPGSWGWVHLGGCRAPQHSCVAQPAGTLRGALLAGGLFLWPLSCPARQDGN